MSEVPKTIDCSECGAEIKQYITGGLGTIFKGSGFPSNDMKGLHTGSSSGEQGRKPTHKELEYVERAYPRSNDSTTHVVEEIQDTATSGTKRDLMKKATDRAR